MTAYLFRLLPTYLKRLWNTLPYGYSIEDSEWTRRHRGIVWLLWMHSAWSARVWTLDELFRHTWYGWWDGSGRARASGNESAYRQPIASCFGDRRLGVGFVIARSPFRWRHRIALPFFRDDGRDGVIQTGYLFYWP